MKRIGMTLLLISSIILSANAQMIIKPAIGLNLTHFSTDIPDYGINGRVGWQIGGTIAFGNEFYLEPGIFWTKNNWEFKSDVGTSDLDFKNDISALKIPVFVGWNVVGAPDDDRNFHVFAGPSAMIVTKVDTEDVGATEDDFNKFIIGANIGAGLSIGKIFVDVGYEWGLNNMYKNDELETKHRSLWINAGFRLTFL
jgi:hypothetical protein